MTKRPDRRIVLALALAADVDTRTASRALTLGLDAIHGVRVQERIAAGAVQVGVTLPASASTEVKGGAR
jgi:hypothetical protein